MMKKSSVLFLCWGFISMVSSSDQYVFLTFHGSEYISYTSPSLKDSVEEKFVVIFKTVHPYGILFHARGSADTFITFELVNGRLRYTSNFGNTMFTSGFHEMVAEQNVADNEWHQVDVIRKGLQVQIIIDGSTNLFTSLSRGEFAKFKPDLGIYAAGVSQSEKEFIQKRIRYGPEKNYRGCMYELSVEYSTDQFINILEKREGEAGVKIHGTLDRSCIMEMPFFPVTFSSLNSVLQIPVAQRTTMSLGFKFRTFLRVGTLLRHKDPSPQGAEMIVSVKQGNVYLQVIKALDVVFSLKAGSDVSDGSWHEVGIHVRSNQVGLIVDGDKAESSHVMEMISGEVVIFGGFIGCMYDVKYENSSVNLKLGHIIKERVKFNQCDLQDPCFPNPCKNRGVCARTVNGSKCNCTGTLYTGSQCQDPEYGYKSTCAEYYALGITRNGVYDIRPLGSTRVIKVDCQMNHTEGPATMVKHDYYGRNVGATDNKKGNYYIHSFEYQHDLTTIEALINSSTWCRQYLSYKCYESVLLNQQSTGQSSDNWVGGRWVSRDGTVQNYWAGATPGSSKCACGEDNTCADEKVECNCDKKDSTWRQDDGYLSDSRTLPVKQLRFSVEGTSHESYFILGDLECFGSNQLPAERTQSSTATLPTISSTLAFSGVSLSSSTSKALLSSSITEPVNFPLTTISSTVLSKITPSSSLVSFTTKTFTSLGTLVSTVSVKNVPTSIRSSSVQSQESTFSHHVSSSVQAEDSSTAQSSFTAPESFFSKIVLKSLSSSSSLHSPILSSTPSGIIPVSIVESLEGQALNTPSVKQVIRTSDVVSSTVESIAQVAHTVVKSSAVLSSAHILNTVSKTVMISSSTTKHKTLGLNSKTLSVPATKHTISDETVGGRKQAKIESTQAALVSAQPPSSRTKSTFDTIEDSFSLVLAAKSGILTATQPTLSGNSTTNTIVTTSAPDASEPPVVVIREPGKFITVSLQSEVLLIMICILLIVLIIVFIIFFYNHHYLQRPCKCFGFFHPSNTPHEDPETGSTSVTEHQDNEEVLQFESSPYAVRVHAEYKSECYGSNHGELELDLQYDSGNQRDSRWRRLRETKLILSDESEDDSVFYCQLREASGILDSSTDYDMQSTSSDLEVDSGCDHTALLSSESSCLVDETHREYIPPAKNTQNEKPEVEVFEKDLSRFYSTESVLNDKEQNSDVNNQFGDTRKYEKGQRTSGNCYSWYSCYEEIVIPVVSPACSSPGSKRAKFAASKRNKSVDSCDVYVSFEEIPLTEQEIPLPKDKVPLNHKEQFSLSLPEEELSLPVEERSVEIQNNENTDNNNRDVFNSHAKEKLVVDLDNEKGSEDESDVDSSFQTESEKSFGSSLDCSYRILNSTSSDQIIIPCVRNISNTVPDNYDETAV